MKELYDGAAIVVFIKYPQPGSVKTRLGMDIGLDEAARVYNHFVKMLLQRLATQSCPVLLALDPQWSISMYEEWLGSQFGDYILQSDGNLGNRLQGVYDHCFKNGYSRIVCLGSDAPDIPLDSVEKAFSVLMDDGGVIGPSIDGGYYLIGLSKNCYSPMVFEDISWSTDKVYLETIAQFKSENISFQRLPVWYDVDTAVDLAALNNRIWGFTVWEKLPNTIKV